MNSYVDNLYTAERPKEKIRRENRKQNFKEPINVGHYYRWDVDLLNYGLTFEFNEYKEKENIL